MSNAPEIYALPYSLISKITFFSLVHFDYREHPALRLGDVLCALAAILWPVSAIVWVTLLCYDAVMDMVPRK